MGCKLFSKLKVGSFAPTLFCFSRADEIWKGKYFIFIIQHWILKWEEIFMSQTVVIWGNESDGQKAGYKEDIDTIQLCFSWPKYRNVGGGRKIRDRT